MPIYEYECQSCGDVQEVMQKISDPAPAACGACRKGPMVKMMSRTAFILKGEGWYVTDFRDKGKKAAKKDDAGSTSDDKSESKAGGDTAKSEAKPAPSDGASATPPATSSPNKD